MHRTAFQIACWQNPSDPLLFLRMAILLCAATQAEIQPTLEWLQAHDLHHKVTVRITGVGLLAAACSITKATFSKPHIMLQAGVAGSFQEGIPLGTTVAVLRETVGDMGVLQNNTFTSAFGMGLLQSNEHPWTAGKLENGNTELLQSAGLPLADGVTVNEISTNADRIAYYKNSLGATAESMEGAALHYTALLERIPFLQIRSFSNYTGERDKAAWRLALAIENLNAALQEILKKLAP